jgi:twitching motility protein PilT
MQLNQQQTGMVTQTQELLEFLQKKIISKEHAIMFSNRPDELMRQIGSL